MSSDNTGTDNSDDDDDEDEEQREQKQLTEIAKEGEPEEEQDRSSKTTTACSIPIPDPDPLLEPPSPVVREGDFVLLVFGDGRQVFAQCLKSWKGKSPPVKIQKRSYTTSNLVGLPYGTVLELGLSGLHPLPHGEEVIPTHPSITGDVAATVDTVATGTDNNNAVDNDGNTNDDDNNMEVDDEDASTFPPLEQPNDNRHLVDDNKSQSLQHDELMRLRRLGTDGSAIVNKLIENSSTFAGKTDFSKAKYVLRKQKKYQPRCRMVRCTAATVCEALFLREPRKLMNMRDDTLGQILSYSNLSAGCRVLVFETCMGVVTGAIAERMGGYGKVFSVYSGQQPSYLEMLSRFNLSFAELNSVKWVHSGDVFDDNNHNNNTDKTTTAATSTNNTNNNNDPPAEKETEEEEVDSERAERELLRWPCPLQDHTRTYLQHMSSDQERTDFLAKRCARFARKLTRHTATEAREWLLARKCDTVIIVARYDPTATLLALLPHLAPSSPFVVYSEFVEPLTECFRELQNQSLAINLRLSDTWMREYQVLPGRTHPNMSISQSGGFILTGIKLCPVTGQNELDDSLLKEIRSAIGGRRGRKPSKQKTDHANDGASHKNNKNKKNKKKRGKASSSLGGGRDSSSTKRPRTTSSS